MSWIKTVPEDQADGLLAEIYDATSAKFGSVINLVKIQSLSPETMSIGKQLYTLLMTKPGGLSRLQRVLIATVVSKINGCHYWMESHEPDLLGEIQDQEKVLKIQEDYTQVDFDPATKTLLDFSTKLTLDIQNMDETDIESLRMNGFSDEDILDAVHLISYFNFINRVLDALGADPEPAMRFGQETSVPQSEMEYHLQGSEGGIPQAGWEIR